MSGGWGTPSEQRANDPVLGQTFVQGKDRETARALLAAADQLGIDRLAVRAVNRGFIVPSEVWDAVHEQRQASDGLDF